jgi:hypothetical protein
MTDFGVTPTGFNRPTLQDLLTERKQEQWATISVGLDLSPESPQGQMNAIGCRQLALAWETLETCYNAFDPDRAEDFLLTALCKLTGTSREGATKSKVTVTVNLDTGTELIAGTHLASVAGKPTVRFTPVENYTAVADGNVQLVFESEVPGPIAADSGTLTVIATALTGWNSVTNANDALLGQVADTDPVLRAKREAQLAAAGSNTARAIVSDLLDLRYNGVQWIKSVKVFENYLETTDGLGLPPKSFEVLVHDQGAPADADNQIAQVIWNNKPGGIRIYGTGETGTAKNELNEDVVVPFSRVQVVNIYIEMALTTVAGFSDVAGVKSYVAEQSDAKFSDPGADVVALFVKGLPLDIEGVTDVPSFTIGTSPSPVGTTNISIDVRQVADFDTARIAIS